ncbi:MAG: hypothetical protein JWO50_46 [Candidatus Kaiserbacteria bacterium]|nr:hypothetical protein [Candidatus Kaiserbacteria bacterium]
MNLSNTENRNTIKYAITWGGVFLFRLILLPWRMPNVEPLMAAVMPTSSRMSVLQSFLFAASSIAVYDAVTSGWGVWTAITAALYGATAIGAHFYFKKFASNRRHFLTYGIIATLAYDALTGFTIGPIFWGQTLSSAIIGQIPFTLMHLAGTILFALVLSPLLARWYAREAAPAAIAVAQHI